MRKFIIKRSSDFSKFLKHFKGSRFSLDTETTGLIYSDLEIEGFSLCDGVIACYVYLADYEKGYKNPDHDVLLSQLSTLISNAKQIVMANAPYDLKVLYKYGIMYEPEIYDIQVGHHLLEEEDRVGLKYLAEKILKVPTINFKDIDDHSSTKFFFYAINDAVWTWKLMVYQLPKLQSQGLEELMRNVESPFQYVLRDMAINGMKLDKDAVVRMHNEAKELTDNLYQEMCDIASIQKEYVRVDSQVPLTDMYKEYKFQIGIPADSKPERGQQHYFGEYVCTIQSGKEWAKTKWKVEKWDYAFNFNSAKQLGELLFVKLGLPVIDMTPSGVPKTSNDVLRKLINQSDFVKKLITYRTVMKLQTSYLSLDGQFISNMESDGYIRANIKDTGAKTGRLSVTDPALQTLPKKRDEFPLPFRSAFICEHDEKMFTVDFSNQEGQSDSSYNR